MKSNQFTICLIGIFAEGTLAQIGFGQPVYFDRPVMLAMQVTPEDNYDANINAFKPSYDAAVAPATNDLNGGLSFDDPASGSTDNVTLQSGYHCYQPHDHGSHCHYHHKKCHHHYNYYPAKHCHGHHDHLAGCGWYAPINYYYAPVDQYYYFRTHGCYPYYGGNHCHGYKKKCHSHCHYPTYCVGSSGPSFALQSEAPDTVDPLASPKEGSLNDTSSFFLQSVNKASNDDQKDLSYAASIIPPFYMMSGDESDSELPKSSFVAPSTAFPSLETQNTDGGLSTFGGVTYNDSTKSDGGFGGDRTWGSDFSFE